MPVAIARQAAVASLRREIPAAGVADVLVNETSWDLIDGWPGYRGRSGLRAGAVAAIDSIIRGECDMADMNDMELRDWFAGQALGGILANAHFPPQGSGEPFDQFAAKVTDSAYRIADTMMREGRRLKKEKTAAW